MAPFGLLSAARPNPARALAERMNARKKPYVNRWLERSRRASGALMAGGGGQVHELGSDRHTGLVFLSPIFSAMRSEEHAVPSCTLRRICRRKMGGRVQPQEAERKPMFE